MKIHYIVALYFGNRRNYPNMMGNTIFLEKHLDFLSSLDDKSPIKHATFSINFDGSVSIDRINKIIDSYKLSIGHSLFIRPNIGYSYANWNDVVKSNINNGYDYHMLMEDDYVPSSNNFYKAFVSEMNDNVCYVAVSIGTVNGRHQLHPTMSIGMLSNEASIKSYQKNNEIIYVCNGMNNSYDSAHVSQEHMLDYLVDCGYSFKEISDKYGKEYYTGNDTSNPYYSITGVSNIGGTDISPIVPILL